MMKKFKTLVFVAASGMILTACGGANNLPFNADEALEEASNIDTPWQDYYAPATSITFAEGEEDLSLAKGETHTYTFQSEPRGLSANSFTWVSSDESVVTTTPGKVTAVGGGEATITVYSEEESLATLNVKVISKLSTINVDPATLDLDFNEKVDLEVTYDPVDTTEQGVSFTVEGTGVTVSESGRVSAGNAAATGEIVVTSKVNQNISKRIPYKVSDKYIHVTGVNFVNPDTKLEINKSLQLNVTVTPDNAQNPEVVYSTDVEGIVSIDENGLVTPLAIGSVNITATSVEQPQIKDTLAIEVYKNVATDIDVGDTTVNLSNTGNKTHQITISYLKGAEPIVPTYTNVSYETSDASVATVNKDGLITMVAKGSAVISVKDKEISSDYVKEITVNCVVNATSVSLSGDSRIQEGGMADLTATISPNASTLSNVPVVTFEVVAGIDNVDLHDNGNGTATVTGLAAGTARIVAKAGTLVSNEFTITIVAPSFEDGGLYLVGNRAFNTGASVEFEGGSWNHPEKAFRFTERTGNANAKFEYKATITFEAGDEWKVRYGANEKPIDGGATGRYKIDEGAFSKGEMGVTTYENPSVVVVVGGVYEIYYAFYENENPEGWYEVFVRAKPTLSLDKNELSIGIGADKVGYIKASDFEGTLQVTSADEETVVVKGYTTDGLITVQGLKEGSSLITVKDNKKTQTCMVTVDNSLVTYTVVGLPTWIGSDNCVVFAWVWSASDSGHWCPATINGTILTFAAPADITGFNLARCAAGTTEPNWKATGNVEGEVYNKTDDFTIVADKYSYQSLAWVEYEYEGGGSGGGESGGEDDPYANKFVMHYLPAGSTEWVDKNLTGKNNNTEYYIENVELDALDEFTFCLGGGSNWFGYNDIKPSSPVKDRFEAKSTESNNIVVKATGAGTYNIYVAVNADASGGGDVGKRIYIAEASGSVTPTPEPQENITINVSLGVWAEANAQVYAWVWGTGFTSHWVKVEDNKLVVPSGITGLKLVRMNPTGCELGDINSYDGLTGDEWGESGDITYVANKTLTVVSWEAIAWRD